MKQIILTFVMLLVFLTACAQPATTPNPTAAANISNIKPAQGTTVLKGRALNLDGTPWADTMIRLAEIYRNPDMTAKEGAFVLNESQSPGTTSDAQGFFIIQNVPARDYVLVIGDIYGKYKVVLDETNYTRVFTLEADKTIDVGDIKIDINAP